MSNEPYRGIQLEPIRMPEAAKAKRTEPTIIDGTMWGPNACARCQKWLPGYMVGVPVEIAHEYCWGHEKEEAVALAALEDAWRRVADLYGGNLDHPALEHIDAATTAVEEIARTPLAACPEVLECQTKGRDE